MNTIDHTISSLTSIINSGDPVNPNKIERHEEKVANAKRYINEINYYALMLQGEHYSIVSRNTFEKIISKSDYVEIEECEFVRIATVSNFPDFRKKLYIWLTPITDL